MGFYHYFLRRRGTIPLSFLLMLLLATSSFVIDGGQVQAQRASARHAHTATSTTAVTTYHNDNMRSGQNTHETLLTTGNVNANTFGKRVSYPVDGAVYAQPLVVPAVQINNQLHNVVYVATENDSLYAFDADQTTAAAPLWHTSFTNPAAGITAVPALDLYNTDFVDIDPIVGITGTPVIDQQSGTIYLVAFTKENGNYIQRLHALDITTGLDKTGSPITILASVQGTGFDNVNGTVTFNPMTQNQRSALLLLNGNIYIDWASFGDLHFYHGWLMGYSYNGSAFQQIGAGVYNNTPNGERGGIWMSGGGPAADASGNIYATTGDGTFDLNTNGSDASNSIIKLSTQNGLHQTDYFAPFNQSCMTTRDGDLGSGAVLLLPDQQNNGPHHLLLTIGKEGRVYVVDRDNMGQFTSDPNLHCDTAEENRTDIDHVVQELPPQTTGGVYGSTGYWNGSSDTAPFVYTGGAADNLRAFSLSGGSLSTHAVSSSPEKFAITGVTPSISSNGTQPGTGIVWINSPPVCGSPDCPPVGPGALRAYDATNLSNELYTSEQNSSRDRVESFVKFSVPTVANGEVFVGTQASLDIYGLLPNQPGITTLDDSVSGQGMLNYTGKWKHCTDCSTARLHLYANSESISQKTKSAVTLLFTGTQISLYAATGPHMGRGIVILDNRPPTRIDFFSRKDAGNQLLWTSPVLRYGTHVFKLLPGGTKNSRSKGYDITVDRVDIAQ